MSRNQNMNKTRKRYPRLGYLASLTIAAVLLSPVTIAAPHYVCGDSNADGDVNLGDVIRTLNSVFKCVDGAKCGWIPDPWESGDANCDHTTNVGDAVYLISYIFRHGPAPCCPPSVLFTDHTECKNFMDSPDTSVPPNQTCVQYEYDGDSTLVLRHINAGLNCCPDDWDHAYAYVMSNDVISLRENSIDGICDCDCLYDLEFTVYDAPPGVYTIHVDERFEFPDEERLEFTITLTGEPSSGMFCVPRAYYPWGDY